MSPTIRRAAGAFAAGLVTLLPCAPAGAQAGVSGPSVELDRYEFAPGDGIGLIVYGFQSSAVTISLCGNEARRGSGDCDMASSQGLPIPADGSRTGTDIAFGAPPVPCPCVIRVANSANSEIAVAPVTLIGHPTAPVENPDVSRQPLSAAIDAEAVVGGLGRWLRAGLGGSVDYDVTVTVRNPMTVAATGVKLEAWVGRSGSDDVDEVIEFDAPGDVAPGQTWSRTTRVHLDAPVLGGADWHLEVVGGGPTVTATDTTRHRPILLVVLLGLLALDVLVLLVRRLARLWRRVRSRGSLPPAPPTDGPVTVVGEGVEQADETRELQAV